MGAGVWVAEATGMLGYVERFALATMTPDPATDVHGTNGIRVRVADEVVWVTDMVAGAGRNYCADPDTGRVLARIALPDLDQDFVLAISGRYIYYVRWAGHGSALRAAAVPSSCLR